MTKKQEQRYLDGINTGNNNFDNYKRFSKFIKEKKFSKIDDFLRKKYPHLKDDTLIKWSIEIVERIRALKTEPKVPYFIKNKKLYVLNYDFNYVLWQGFGSISNIEGVGNIGINLNNSIA